MAGESGLSAAEPGTRTFVRLLSNQSKFCSAIPRDPVQDLATPGILDCVIAAEM